MRNDRPWFPMYGRDFRVACVGAMTLEETGAYSLIITLLYECGGRLPDRDDFIAKQIGTSTRVWRRIREKLVTLGKLCVDGEVLTNKRVETELVAAEKLSEARAKAGRAGGLAPRKTKPEAESLDDVLPQFLESLPETFPKLLANDDAKPLILNGLGEASAKRFSTVTITDTEDKGSLRSPSTAPRVDLLGEAAPEPKPRKAKAKRALVDSPGPEFDAVWAAWPKKREQPKAIMEWQAWAAAVPANGKPPAGRMQDAVMAYLNDPTTRRSIADGQRQYGNKGQFLPTLGRWLNEDLQTWLNASHAAAYGATASSGQPVWDTEWRKRWAEWAKRKLWDQRWGPRPDEAGYLGPAPDDFAKQVLENGILEGGWGIAASEEIRERRRRGEGLAL